LVHCGLIEPISEPQVNYAKCHRLPLIPQAVTPAMISRGNGAAFSIVITGLDPVIQPSRDDGYAGQARA
jgi:hypothetical protein